MRISCAVIVAFMAPSGVRATTYSEHAAAIRADIFGGDYDKNVVPSSARRGPYSDMGTDVMMQIRFVQVVSVEPTSGLMALKVWVRMRWVDDRLAWTPAAFGNVSEVVAAAVADDSEAETNEVWVPDVTLYNGHGAYSGMLEAARPNIYSDGTVFLSRPGTLEVLCKYSGLVAFPFDTLKCQFDVGSWSYDTRFQEIIAFPPMPNGCERGFVELAFANQGTPCGLTREGEGHGETVGDSYTEFHVKGVSVTNQSLYYPSSPLPYSVIAYRVSLDRASNFYVLIVIIPDIVSGPARTPQPQSSPMHSHTLAFSSAEARDCAYNGPLDRC